MSFGPASMTHHFELASSYSAEALYHELARIQARCNVPNELVARIDIESRPVHHVSRTELAIGYGDLSQDTEEPRYRPRRSRSDVQTRFMTCMETSYADGTVGGPAFVFPSDGKMGLRRDYIRSSQRALVPSTTIYHASSDGRTNSAFTLAWLEAGLIPEIERRRAAIDEPDSLAIFMFDIESLEMTTEISTRLEAANILPFALPVQVADLVRFEPLTTAFEYTLACSGQAGKEVPLTDFLGWYAQIRHCSLTSQQVVARFTGRFVVPAQAARNNSAVCSFKGSLSASPSKSDSSSTEDEVQCSHEETLRTSTRRGGPANCKRWLPCNLH